MTKPGIRPTLHSLWSDFWPALLLGIVCWIVILIILVVVIELTL